MGNGPGSTARRAMDASRGRVGEDPRPTTSFSHRRDRRGNLGCVDAGVSAAVRQRRSRFARGDRFCLNNFLFWTEVIRSFRAETALSRRRIGDVHVALRSRSAKGCRATLGATAGSYGILQTAGGTAGWSISSDFGLGFAQDVNRGAACAAWGRPLRNRSRAAWRERHRGASKGNADTAPGRS